MKRLTLIVSLGFLPLLTTSCGGPIAKAIMEAGTKKFVEILDPTWRSTWFITKPLSELNGLIQAFSGFAALVGFAVALWLTLMVLKGHGLSIGAKGILLLVSVVTIAGVIPLTSGIGQSMMPEEMKLSNYVTHMGLIDLSPNLAKAGIITASALFAWMIPHVNQLVQMIVAIIFCITMVGVIASASPRGFILAGSWLIGPVIVPRIFWVVVTTTVASIETTGFGPIDEGVIIARNGMVIAVFILVAVAAYTMPYVVVKTFIWVGDLFHVFPREFKSLNEEPERDTRSRSSSSDFAAGLFGGAIASDLVDGEGDETSPEAGSRQNGNNESDNEDDGSAAGSNKNSQRLLADPDGIVDVEAEDVPPDEPDSDGGPNGDGPSTSPSPTPLSEDDALRPVDDDLDQNPPTEPDGGEVYRKVTRILREEDHLQVVHEVSVDMQTLIDQYKGFEFIPFENLTLNRDWADDVRQQIEAAIWEKSNYVRFHSGEEGLS